MKPYQVSPVRINGDMDRWLRPNLVPADPAPRLAALRRATAEQALRSPKTPGTRVAGYACLRPGEKPEHAVAEFELHARLRELRLYDVYLDTAMPTAPGRALSAWEQAAGAVIEARADGIFTRSTADVSTDPGEYERVLRELADRSSFLAHIYAQWVRL
ncbi:hypothetical protein [Streptomyces sp. NPDC048442]|uniref:hypothetical protein n=1 Tax=Streptomyces sp. NPDC048442 TaxID=3154823 RepID=UPI003428F56E